MPQSRPLAIVTGASSGIGYELARVCAKNGFDLVIAANEPRINDAALALREFGVAVTAVDADLAHLEGVDALLSAVDRRPVDILMANAGESRGQAFLDQDFGAVAHIIATNVTGTLYLLHNIGKQMKERGSGRILITGSIAGFIPGPFNAIYNATKAFIDSFSWAFRNELQDSGVTVTCLMPGATETEFFARAGLLDSKLGQAKKDDPADVAQIGFNAMMSGDGDVVSGWYNKVQSAIANITPASLLADQHRRLAEPGSGKAPK